MKPVLAAVIAALVAAPAVADAISPFTRRVSVSTTVTFAEPLPEYVFYAVDLPRHSRWVTITLDHSTSNVIPPYGNEGMTLVAVPKVFADRYPTPDAVRKAMDVEKPDGVARVHLGNLEPFRHEVVISAERKIVIRRGSNGLEFDVIQEPRTTIWVGLLLAAGAIFLGVRWARRRRTRT